jgi:N-methylhydantoinase A
VLGYLGSDAPLAGGVALDRERAERAVSELAAALGLETLACAEGIVRVANAEMMGALRVVTVQRGVDPRRHALLAFGGAGPLHAAAIATELGIETIVCPRDSGVLAALGLVASPRRRDAQRSVLLSGDALSAEAIATVTAALGDQARRALGEPQAELRASYELRYRGQAFELAIDGSPRPDPRELRESFESEHEERYGYRDADQELELVTVRVSAIAPGATVELQTGAGEPITRGRREATLGGSRVELETLRGAPPSGTEIAGPSVVELASSTLLVPPGWSGAVDQTGTIRLTHAK